MSVPKFQQLSQSLVLVQRRLGPAVLLIHLGHLALQLGHPLLQLVVVQGVIPHGGDLVRDKGSRRPEGRAQRPQHPAGRAGQIRHKDGADADGRRQQKGDDEHPYSIVSQEIFQGQFSFMYCGVALALSF